MSRHSSYDPSKHRITLLEASKIAGGASGKAGGLLALWGKSSLARSSVTNLTLSLAYPSSIVPLSYRLHAELAKEHNGKEIWGYRRIHCGQLTAKGRPLGFVNENKRQAEYGDSLSLQKRSKEAISLLRAAGIPKDLDWFATDSVRAYSEMGDPSTTAQVHPYQFTTLMASLAEQKGVKVVLGSVTHISHPNNAVQSVTYKDKATSEIYTLPATDVIIAAGPWTRAIYPPAPISAMRAHSVTIRPSRPVSAYALFTDIILPADFGRTPQSTLSERKNSKRVTPELYARPNNEVYACGEGDTLVPLPKISDEVVTDESRCQDIVDYAASISDEMRDGEVTVRQACYLPNVEAASEGPLIGETGVKGLLLAAGHTCWGIQNGPATGKLMSEFVFEGGAKSASVEGLDPRKVLRA